jgi:BASS family bile acid:Na+ symporter
MESLTYIDFLISVVLATIMFGLGLSLTLNNFKRIVLYPRAFIIGLLSQMLILPAIAFVILLFADLPPEFKVGIMILAACPGGTTSGFITYLFKGNVALSISMTTINSMLTIFTIPIIVNLALEHYMGTHVDFQLPFGSSVLQIFLVTVLPAALGVSVRQLAEKTAHVMEKYLKYIMILLLAGVYTIKFFVGEQHGGTGITGDEVWTIFPYALIFNVVCFVFSIFVGKLSRLRIRDAFTIAIEVSLHNTTLALLIGGTLLQNQDLVKPALIYTLFSFWSALVFGILTKVIYKKQFVESK